jgi:hypothetical protein
LGEVVFKENDFSNNKLYVILSGKIVVVKKQDIDKIIKMHDKSQNRVSTLGQGPSVKRKTKSQNKMPSISAEPDPITQIKPYQRENTQLTQRASSAAHQKSREDLGSLEQHHHSRRKRSKSAFFLSHLKEDEAATIFSKVKLNKSEFRSMRTMMTLEMNTRIQTEDSLPLSPSSTTGAFLNNPRRPNLQRKDTLKNEKIPLYALSQSSRKDREEDLKSNIINLAIKVERMIQKTSGMKECF